jgi:hypothetical protein
MGVGWVRLVADGTTTAVESFEQAGSVTGGAASACTAP